MEEFKNQNTNEQRSEGSNRIYSTAKDLDNAVNSVTFVAYPWIAQGVVTLLISAPGLGKTQIVADISKRFLNPELGWFDDQPLEVPSNSVVVWCDTEAFQGALKDLFDKLGIDKDRVILPFRDPLQEVQLDKDIEHLDQVILETKPSLLIVDSLRGSHKNDENDSTMQHMISALSKLVQKYNISCILIHHTNKPAPGMPDVISSIHRVRGSSAIAAQCRTVWALDNPNPSSGYLQLQVIKNNLAPQADPVGVRITDSGIEWKARAPEQPRPEKKESRVNEALLFLIRELNDGCPRPAKDIEEKAEQEGIAVAALRRASKWSVRKEKEPVENGQWLWSLNSFNLSELVPDDDIA